MVDKKFTRVAQKVGDGYISINLPAHTQEMFSIEVGDNIIVIEDLENKEIKLRPRKMFDKEYALAKQHTSSKGENLKRVE
jgi:hypothetical protein